MIEVAQNAAEAVLGKLQTNENGLSEEEAEERLEKYGPNVVAQEQRHGRLRLLGHACINPLVILLLAAGRRFRLLTGDPRAGTVMLIMVVLGVSLRFVQEARADDAAAKLKAMISVTATVVRDGAAKRSAAGPTGARRRGPAGGRRHDSRRPPHPLLQGPVRHPVEPDRRVASRGKVRRRRRPAPSNPLLELKNVCFLGTSVESGTATGVVVETGLKTYLGGMASSIVGQQVQTSFDKGVSKFTWLMIYFMLVMVPLVFLINGLTKHDWIGRLLLRPGRGRGPDARNAADDRHGLPVARARSPCRGRR